MVSLNHLTDGDKDIKLANAYACNTGTMSIVLAEELLFV